MGKYQNWKIGCAALVACFVCSAQAAVADQAKDALSRVIPSSITYIDKNGVMYSRNEFAHLAKGELAGGAIAGKAACTKPKNADPLPALRAFNDELKKLGIKLLVVPVPPKSSVMPPDGWRKLAAMSYLLPFYAELTGAGIEVVDLSTLFAESEKPCFCRTDAHWNSHGISLAAEQIAKLIPLRGNSAFKTSVSAISASGDLALSAAAKSGNAPVQENLELNVVEGDIFDDESPVLILGDSHTLFFSTGSDMLAENAGFCEQLAAKLHSPVDRIGVRGSSATAVRINLYRKAAKDPEWLKRKKYIVYLFSCREFSESTSGWVTVPVLKK